MAITAQTQADSRVRIQMFFIYSLIGIAAGVFIGWQVEVVKLGQHVEYLALDFTLGCGLNLLDLNSLPLVGRSKWMDTFLLVTSQYPAAAQLMTQAIKKALVFPWPLIGWAAGLGALSLISKLNDFTNKRSSK